MRAIRGTAMAAALALSALPAFAQEGAEFFNGKTITYIVATDPGGGYDTNGRLVAEFLQKYLPGSTVVVQNMPGAGHIIGANYIFASEPDGLTIGTFNTGLIYNQLIELDGVQFDLAEMSWIGKVASEPRVFVMSEQSGIDSFEALQSAAEPLKFGSAGVGSASYVETTMLQQALELPIDLITGYNGSDDQLAMRRGEIQGSVASRSSYQQFVDEGHAQIIAQIGGSETDVPQLATLVEGEEAQGGRRADPVAERYRAPDRRTSRNSGRSPGSASRGLSPGNERSGLSGARRGAWPAGRSAGRRRTAGGRGGSTRAAGRHDRASGKVAGGRIIARRHA
jgi:tripartite-type tricarboxylate transporter receptor subunit TctC